MKGRIVLAQFSEPSNVHTMRYLSGLLRENGYTTTLLSVRPSIIPSTSNPMYREYSLSDKAIDDILELADNAVFFGISLFTFEAHIIKRLYDKISKNINHTPVVVGGPHSILDPFHASFMSDYVCLGDGEEGIIQLADLLISGEDIKSKLGEICTNIYSSSFIRNEKECAIPKKIKESPLLDVKPTFDFDSEYVISNLGVVKITEENAHEFIDDYSTVISRGCVYNCTYCAHESLAQRSGFKKRIKSKNVDSAIEELSYITTKYKWVKRIVFFDPNILANKRENIFAFFEKYKKNINLPFLVSGLTFNQVNEEIFKSLLEAGLSFGIFGIESGSEKTRALFGREHEKLSRIREVDQLIQKLKKTYYFNIQYDIILDVPWETPSEVLKSLHFVSSLKGYDVLDIFSLRLFPGTKLFQKALDEGLIEFKTRDTEYKKTYRGLEANYQNFLFVLLADRMLPCGLALWILTQKNVVTVMRRIFSTKCGVWVFKFYNSLMNLGVRKTIRVKRKIAAMVRALGLIKTVKMLCIYAYKN